MLKLRRVMITNKDLLLLDRYISVDLRMRERVEKAFELLGRNPTMEEYAEYLGLKTT